MQGERTAEGIALLSFYNDEEGDESELDAEKEEEGEGNGDEDGGQRSGEKVAGDGATIQGESGSARHYGSSQTRFLFENPRPLTEAESYVRSEAYTKSDSHVKPESFVRSESYMKSESFVKSESCINSESYVKPEEFVDRSGNGAHGVIVDYAHDDPALSPETEEAEIFNTGRAVIGSTIQTYNGFVEGVTPPSGRILTPEDAPTDDRNKESKIVTCLDHTIVTDSMVDIEMSDAEDGVTMTSETDILADFLPPTLTRKCSDELQQKFEKYLALKKAGRSFNDVLRKSKGYRNPDFLQRAVIYQEIDQIGTCFKKEIFDPHGYDPTDFYDALLFDFKREQEKKEQSKKLSQRADSLHGAGLTTLPDKTKTSIITIPALQKGGSVMNPLATANQGVVLVTDTVSKSDTGRSSKSKWDKLEPDPRPQVPLPPVVKTTQLTANAGGGYASFVQQKRKELEERSRGFDKMK